MTCLENLEKCKAMCCVGFKLPKVTLRRGNHFLVGNLSPDMARYYELHAGVKYACGWLEIEGEITEDEKFWKFSNSCKMLLPNRKCKIYYRNRPQICIDGYTKLKEGVEFVPNCIYTQVEK